jgi:ribose transport system ATP-binding protein
VVQQELSLAPHLSIAENIGLGAHPRRGGVVDYGRLAAAVAEIGKELDLIESPDTPVERLPLEPRSLPDKVLILARSPERCCW